ncbi:MAG: hypothetical protein ACFE89_07380 [Candidatus Hodarchaeota archaeon]
MKKWFAYLVLLAGIYDLMLAALFLFASPFVSILLAYPISPLSAALLQICGAFLFAFGLALVVASRNLDQLLVIPVVNSILRLLFFVILLYYIIIWSLPVLLLVFGVIDAIIGILFLAFTLAIKDYGFRAILPKPRT